MPIYEYECGHCKARFEVKQGFDEEPQAACPQCQGRARRLFYPSPVIFKGSGFYITDSRKGEDKGDGRGQGAGDKPGRKGKVAEGNEGTPATG